MKILVAEDGAMMRRVLVETLKKWQYEVVETVDGTEAWERFQQERFPLVVTDWIMPGMDGLELIARIRASESAGYTYIILLTAKSEKVDLVEAMDAGADDFLIKPCHPDELRVRIREGERILRLEQTLADQNRHLRETQAALVHSEKLVSLAQLAAGMAHEINNPISYVSNNLTVLQRDVTLLLQVLEKYRAARPAWEAVQPELAAEIAALEEEGDIGWLRENLPRLLESSHHGIRRVRDIVNNLRAFARLDEAELDELDLAEALHSTVEVLRAEMDACGVVPEFQLAANMPRLVCRPAKIHQVLYHLVQNAVQASPPQGRVHLRTALEEDQFAVVEVEDHGSGIEPGHLSRIFEPFFTTKPVGRGAGLGLAIAYGIVRDHGGTIEVQSEPHRGSTFRVRLPLKPPHE